MKLNDTKFQKLRERLQARYLDRTGQRSEKTDESRQDIFTDKMADEAETAAKTQNIAALYKIIKNLPAALEIAKFQ